MKGNKTLVRFIFAMVIFGTIGIFVKNIPLPSGEIALFRAVIAVIALLGFQLMTNKKFAFTIAKKEMFLLLLSGAAMGFNWILLFEAYNYTSISIATLSYYFAPVIVMVISPFLFKEPMGVKQWLCFLIATTGLVLIVGVSYGEHSSNQLLGIGLGLGAAFLYATVIILNKFIKQVTGIDRTLFQFISAIIVLIPYVGLTTGIHIQGLEGIGLGSLLLLGLVHTGFTYCLYFSSLKDLPGQKVAILSYLDPLVAITISVLLLQERIRVAQIIGGALILGVTLMNELSFISKEASS